MFTQYSTRKFNHYTRINLIQQGLNVEKIKIKINNLDFVCVIQISVLYLYQLRNKVKKKVMLSTTIENRATELIINGMDVMEAVKTAINEENELIAELIENKTGRAINAKNQMAKIVFAIHNLK